MVYAAAGFLSDTVGVSSEQACTRAARTRLHGESSPATAKFPERRGGPCVSSSPMKKDEDFGAHEIMEEETTRSIHSCTAVQGLADARKRAHRPGLVQFLQSTSLSVVESYICLIQFANCCNHAVRGSVVWTLTPDSTLCSTDLLLLE